MRSKKESMSSLIFVIEETQVLVAADTLAVRQDGTPSYFTTKAFALPHLRMVIAGTGSAGFLDAWFYQINTRMRRRGIDHLNEYAPTGLARLWAEHNDLWEKAGVKPNTITTVYHFGFSETAELVHAFAYRSENGFRSDPIGYGTGAKPECTRADLSVQQVLEDPPIIRKMMDEQRAIQRNLPREQRLYIGGQIQVHCLAEKGYVYSVFTMSHFDDFEEDAEVIYNLPKA